jgi:hypothetical protein
VSQAAAGRAWSWVSRAFWALCGTFVGATTCWMLWDLLAPGAYFAGVSGQEMLSLPLGGVPVGYVAFQCRSRRFRAWLSVVALLCAIFWIHVPGGWWGQVRPALRRTPAAGRP